MNPFEITSADEYAREAAEFEARKRQRMLEEQLAQGKLSMLPFEQQKMQAEAEAAKSLGTLGISSGVPSEVQAWQYFSKMPPEEQQKYLNLKRAGQVMNLGGTVAVRDPLGGGISESYPVTPKETETAPFRAGVTSAETTAREEAQRLAMRPKAYAALQDFKNKSSVVQKSIDRALSAAYGGTPAEEILKEGFSGKPSGLATGLGAALGLDSIPNSNAGALKNELETIKANISFGALQSMRENSPTGGALGSTSDLEVKLLGAVNGALDPKQSDQLVKNLRIIRENYPLLLAEREAAYNRDYAQKPVTNNTPLADQLIDAGMIPPLGIGLDTPAPAMQPMDKYSQEEAAFNERKGKKKTVRFEDLPE